MYQEISFTEFSGLSIGKDKKRETNMVYSSLEIM